VPLKKLSLKAGINQENTRYTNENGWWVADKIRFRQGTPEKIGGWARLSSNSYLGVCRSLFPWGTNGGVQYMGVGTNIKFYVEFDGAYNDITPVVSTATLTNPFVTTSGSAVVVVNDVAHGSSTGSYVTFSGAVDVGGITAAMLNKEFAITVVTADQYTITVSGNATSNATGGGTVTAQYQLPIGNAVPTPLSGWGAGGWGLGPWGTGTTSATQIRLWSQANFGQDLLFAYRGGPLCYWASASGLSTRGVLVSSLVGASDVPVVVNSVLVSDSSRFAFAFGCNELGTTSLDPMLIRWSDQEDVANWTPAVTNQAGGIRLSHGSEIVAALQTRQEILVWTDTALYSLQYQGPPFVWGVQLLADNVSIISNNAMVTVAGRVFWMGNGKFYSYAGNADTMRCDLRQYIFQNFNYDMSDQVFCGSNEQFNEVWWFYPSSSSTTPNKYIIYNYLEDVWIMGELERFAWVDRGVRQYPTAAGTDKLIQQEFGVDDAAGASTVAIPAYIESAEFDIDDGDHFAFVRRMLPDITFRGSTADNPSVLFTLYPMKNSGTGFGTSVGGSRDAEVIRSVAVPVEEFTGQVFIRVRGRQMVIRVESTALGVTWQLGSPRIDMRQDGRR
jgi:hypothetical protein